VSIKNDGHYFCRAGGNRPDGLNEPVTSRDAVERQMSHQERSSVRAAYIHKAEHLGERMLMLQWWAAYLDANRMAAITPFDYAKINSSFR
ncbi:hypothetical protein R9S72_06895, partial [Escherichia coli]